MPECIAQVISVSKWGDGGDCVWSSINHSGPIPTELISSRFPLLLGLALSCRIATPSCLWALVVQRRTAQKWSIFDPELYRNKLPESKLGIMRNVDMRICFVFFLAFKRLRIHPSAAFKQISIWRYYLPNSTDRGSLCLMAKKGPKKHVSTWHRNLDRTLYVIFLHAQRKACGPKINVCKSLL